MKRLHVSILLLSVALIAFQLAWMQVLSMSQWYHFAFMVISVALLGFGASGTLISLLRSWIIPRVGVLLPMLMALCGLSMAGTFPLSQTHLFRFDSYRVFLEGSHVAALLLSSFLLFIPFFFGALALGVVFVTRPQQIGSLYFANMVGSGLGGVVALWIMHELLPQEIPPLIAVGPLISALLVLPERRRRTAVTVLLLGLVSCSYFFLFPPEIRLSEYKGLSRALLLPDARIEMEKPGPQGLVQVVSSPALRHAPGLSLTFRGAAPAREALFNNGDWFGQLPASSSTDTSHILDYTSSALPYVMGRRAEVLTLGARTGMSVGHALARGAAQVVAVEPHIGVADLLLHELAPLTDSLLWRDGVAWVTMDPRSFVLRDTATYDLVLLPMLETFGGTAGVYALQEQYLLTREAFHNMWRRLRSDGVISISSWMDHPWRNPLRVLSTLVEVLEAEGIPDPAGHLVAVRSWGTITFAMKRTPLTAEEIARVRRFCNDMGFDPALLPGLDKAERDRFNTMSDDTFFRFLDEILSPHRERLFEEYDFHLRPSTDDRPYFSQFLRWKSLPRLRELVGDHAIPFLEIGYLIVVVTLLQIVAAVFLLVGLPLAFSKRRSGTTGWTLLYFGALGLGYIFVEMILVQRFVLFLGHPMYAVAFVISSMLVFSGVGSSLSARLATGAGVLLRVTGLIALLILLYALELTPVLRNLLSLPQEGRFVVAILVVAVPAVAMGMPFPLGIRFLAGEGEQQLAWAWAMNGCMSVAGTALAVVAAVEAGFVVVMGTAAAAYGLAALASAALTIRRRKTVS